MSTNRQGHKAGFTIAETLIVITLLVLLGLVAGQLLIFGARGFQATSNYLELETDSRVALDTMSRDIRQAQSLISYTPHHLVFLDADGTQLQFYYSPYNKSLYRVKGTSRAHLLEGCDYLQFAIFQRTPIAGEYQFFPSTTSETAKLVQIRWICSRRNPGSPYNTECIQNAAVVIRKKKGV